MDLLVEQIKMLAGEIAFGTSTLKRLMEQSANDPDGTKIQIENLEHEIQEKQRQMRVLEQRIIESGEASMANASMVEMQQNQKLAEEASYAKELASAAAVELKNLAGEVTKLSLQNERQAKELLAIQDLAAYSKTANGTICRFSESKNDGIKLGRKGRPPSRSGDAGNKGSDDMDNRNLDLGDVRMELQVRKQKEDTLEAALAEKVHLEKEYKKELEEAKKREISLENDLASILQSVQAKIQEMKEREFDSSGNGDTNSNVCKVCFESPTAAVLLPCRHFCCKHFRLHSAAISAVVLLCLGINGLFDIEPVCKPCSLACSECPLCRTKIADRIITFTS
ncbi:hypothetical protein BHE74_00027772 [Ensete ventricosum]|nr:hypothetical protein GW17_00040776 [Ensete ventricosum]RWW64964.1 hypothetical protein BHE74_00027772 [Ensete ventricosum]